MLIKATQITIFVNDYDQARQFYTEKLGFVVRYDEEFGAGWRYLAVSPQENNETMIELAQAQTPEQQELIGKQAADQVLVMFMTDDIDRDYQEMKARGVEFNGQPQPVPGGRGVGFKDLDGNQLDMFEPEST